MEQTNIIDEFQLELEISLCIQKGIIFRANIMTLIFSTHIVIISAFEHNFEKAQSELKSKHL